MEKYLVQMVCTAYQNIEVYAENTEMAKEKAKTMMTDEWMDAGDSHVNCVERIYD